MQGTQHASISAIPVASTGIVSQIHARWPSLRPRPKPILSDAGVEPRGSTRPSDPHKGEGLTCRTDFQLLNVSGASEMGATRSPSPLWGGVGEGFSRWAAR